MTQPHTTNVTTPGDRDIVMTRVFDAPRERVFKAYTDPDAIARWWGPRGWTTENRRMDVRPGGTWHYCMRGPDGAESWGLGVYREVVEPERLVYVDSFSDADGNTVPPSMVITVTFAEQGEKTRLTVHTVFSTPEERDQVLEMGVVEGMNETLDRLEELLAEG
jgi:uncharacterized protein YndB with AHSA1/START domain